MSARERNDDSPGKTSMGSFVGNLDSLNNSMTSDTPENALKKELRQINKQ